jgi:precorrin-6B C5,15-methyltransferase / cobalt-precorrin-6B C5,C15-methyltransferase
VFVGGSGREVSRIVELAFERLRPDGRLVVTVSSIDTLSAVRSVLESLAGDVQVWMVNIARGTYQMDRMVFESLNPTFLIGARKEARGAAPSTTVPGKPEIPSP